MRQNNPNFLSRHSCLLNSVEDGRRRGWMSLGRSRTEQPGESKSQSFSHRCLRDLRADRREKMSGDPDVFMVPAEGCRTSDYRVHAFMKMAGYIPWLDSVEGQNTDASIPRQEMTLESLHHHCEGRAPQMALHLVPVATRLLSSRSSAESTSIG